MWDSFDESHGRFLVQGFRMVSEQLFPYYINGNENAHSKAKWATIHDKLSMELGLSELSPKYYSYPSTWNGNTTTHTGTWTLDEVCKKFVCSDYTNSISADRFIKERISFIEIAFRERELEVAAINKTLPKKLQDAQLQGKSLPKRGIRVPDSQVDAIQAHNDLINESFRNSVNELNERLMRADFNLNYHNGFIQISDDELTEEQIEKEFWVITKDDLWKNVDIDMKEAIDLRDSNGRDPAFYAARALESTIKIISDQKKWTHSGEKGAHNYIDNLGSKKKGSFINSWESDTLKAFFTNVRNPFSHGSGSKEMPKLSPQQTNWAIETCMSWVKTLVKRM